MTKPMFRVSRPAATAATSDFITTHLFQRKALRMRTVAIGAVVLLGGAVATQIYGGIGVVGVIAGALVLIAGILRGHRPLVTVEVRAFEEVLAPAHEARVAIAVHVADARCIRLRQTFAASRPLDGDDPSALARGIGESLGEVARDAGQAVRRAASARGCHGKS